MDDIEDVDSVNESGEMDSTNGSENIDGIDDIEKIYEDALKTFREENHRFIPEFTRADARSVKKQIYRYQQDQEPRNALKDFSRIRDTLMALERFQEAVDLDVEKKEYIWGPFKSVLKRAFESGNILDNVLQTYFKLGKHIPRVDGLQALVQDNSAMQKCMAYMYHDTLCFQSEMLRLFSNPDDVWKVTFLSTWTDRQERFNAMVDRFKGNSKTLNDLIKVYQIQRNGDDSSQIARNGRTIQDTHVLLEESQGRIDSQLQAGNQMMSEGFAHVNRHARLALDRQIETQTQFQEFIERYNEDRERERQRHGRKEDERKKMQLQEALSWVNASAAVQEDFHKGLREICEKHPRTTDWIVEDQEDVSNWINEAATENPILWIRGIQGGGKTVLASEIIENCKQRQDSTTCYFYCSNDDPGQINPRVIYVHLLRQMIEQNHELLPYFCHKKQNSIGTELQHEDEAKSLVKICCASHKKHYIIIDGLDECGNDQIRTVLKFFRDLVKDCNQSQSDAGKLRVLFVSRDDHVIQKSPIMVEDAKTFSMDADHNRVALEKYLEQKTEELVNKFGPGPLPAQDEETSSPALDQEAERELERVKGICQRAFNLTLNRAKGMFLFAKLVMQHLHDQWCLDRMEEELSENKFPKELDDAYKNIVDRLERDLSEPKWETTKMVLGWLICVKRPLRLHEFLAAFAIVERDNGVTNVNRSGRAFKDDIIELCSCLVRVVDNRIVFSHETARRWIIDKSGRWDTAFLECDRAITCISYLSANWFNFDLEETHRKAYAETGYYAFLDYAASRWMQHLETVIAKSRYLMGDESRWYPYRVRISSVLKKFVELHKEDLGVPRGMEAEPITSSARQKCSDFQGQPFYEDLVLVWAHILAHRGGKCKQISIKRLRESVEKIRGQVEELDIGDGRASEFYGGSIFKCDRIMCDFFYIGFKNKPQREKHQNRHDRPYECDDPGCTIQPIGFSTNKDKEKHMRAYHLSLVLHSLPGFVEPVRQPLATARFSCDDCGRRFTRNANLVAHQRNHTGLRPYECSHCDRAFTRNNDRRRHEKTRHSSRRGPNRG